MSEAKPIFIIRYPNRICWEDIKKYIVEAKSVINDYHLVFVPTENKEIIFECYNSKEANEMDFKLLQERVIGLLKKHCDEAVKH